MHIEKLNNKSIWKKNNIVNYTIFTKIILPKYLNLYNIKTSLWVDYLISKMKRGSHKEETPKTIN